MDKTNLPPLPEPGINTANHAHVRVKGYTAEQMREYATAALRATTGEGEWVLVPREPTEAMIEAGDEFYPWTRGTESRRAMPAPETIYEAMIAAAPTQDQENGS